MPQVYIRKNQVLEDNDPTETKIVLELSPLQVDVLLSLIEDGCENYDSMTELQTLLKQSLVEVGYEKIPENQVMPERANFRTFADLIRSKLFNWGENKVASFDDWESDEWATCFCYVYLHNPYSKPIIKTVLYIRLQDDEIIASVGNDCLQDIVQKWKISQFPTNYDFS